MKRFIAWLRSLRADWRRVPPPNVRSQRYQPSALSEWAFNSRGELTNE